MPILILSHEVVDTECGPRGAGGSTVIPDLNPAVDCGIEQHTRSNPRRRAGDGRMIDEILHLLLKLLNLVLKVLKRLCHMVYHGAVRCYFATVDFPVDR